MTRQTLRLLAVRRETADNLSTAAQRPIRPADVVETMAFLAACSGTADWHGMELVVRVRAWLVREYRSLYRFIG